MRVSNLNTTEYHSYYHPYIAILGNPELMQALFDGLDFISDFVLKIPKDSMNFSYAQGKWTIAEVLIHLMDTERIFQYRALRFARNDKTELQGFDQDSYVPESQAPNRSRNDILEEFIAIRKSSIALFASLNDEMLLRSGLASGAKMSVRALGFVICGHQVHHFNILQERYLS